jgi:hypothetical protein
MARVNLTLSPKYSMLAGVPAGYRFGDSFHGVLSFFLGAVRVSLYSDPNLQ